MHGYDEQHPLLRTRQGTVVEGHLFLSIAADTSKKLGRNVYPLIWVRKTSLVLHTAAWEYSLPAQTTKPRM